MSKIRDLINKQEKLILDKDFEEGYKIFEKFLNKNNLNLIKIDHDTYGQIILFQLNAEQSPTIYKTLCMFYKTSFGPRVIYYNFNKDIYFNIVNRTSKNPIFNVKIYPNILFEE